MSLESGRHDGLSLYMVGCAALHPKTGSLSDRSDRIRSPNGMELRTTPISDSATAIFSRRKIVLAAEIATGRAVGEREEGVGGGVVRPSGDFRARLN